MGRSSRLLPVLLASALLIGACGSDDESSSTTTSSSSKATSTSDGTASSTSSTTTTTIDPTDPAAVVAAYRRAWEVYIDFANGTSDKDLEDFYIGERLDNVRLNIADFSESQTRLEGAVVVAPGPVTIDGEQARFEDCFLDGTRNVIETTGEVTDEPDALPMKANVLMLLDEGRWKLAYFEVGPQGSCTQ